MVDFLNGTIALFGDPLNAALFAGAVLFGLVFSIIPGLGPVTLATILLPFLAHLTAAQAIMILAVIYCIGVYGGAVSAILFNIPGGPENAPTAFDGYPMAQQGRAGKAIGAAITCSAIGGTVSAVMMMVGTAYLAQWAIRAFGPPEVFALIFFGLSVSAAVGADTVWKGFLSVCLGLLIGTIGTDPAGGMARFHFGQNYLMAGVNFIPLILGFFAISEVFIQGRSMALGIHVPPKIGIEFPSLKEFWQLKLAIFRSTMVGFFCGMLPGIGATLAAFMSYAEAVRWSRHPERFGRGEIEGVAASETANNAATGGAMIPLLALGLPGGALTAVMVGAFQMHGIEPGPMVLITSKDLVWMVFVAMFFANLCILGLGYLETRMVVHLLRIPFSLLAPTIVLVAVIGAYGVRNLLLDVWVMVIAGIIGFIMRRSGYSMAGVVLGVILGDLGESAFVKSMQLLDYDLFAFFGRPICAILIVAGFVSLGFSLRRGLKRAPAR
ncbi:MAG: hypothetical protein EXQ96_09755 [Alphaproteobacteria bacterium]|nr:hypothetical protein [Alphaproteobacteria bacterium]